jgi:hypothetical protein
MSWYDQRNANASHSFLLTVCLGIVVVAGIPEARINLNFAFFRFFIFFWLALSGFHLHHFCQLQYYNGFLLSLSPGRTLNF